MKILTDTKEAQLNTQISHALDVQLPSFPVMENRECFELFSMELNPRSQINRATKKYQIWQSTNIHSNGDDN